MSSLNHQMKANFNYRFTKLLWGVGLSLIAIIIRLIHMQVILSSNFLWLGEKNYLRTESVASLRGNIIDSNGQLLATNRPVILLHWQGTGSKKLTASQQHTLEQLGRLISLTVRQDEIEYAEKQSKRIEIAHDLSINQLSAVLEQFPDHENLVINTVFERFYPHKTLACHLIGYLGSLALNPSGKMGLELVFEHELKGKTGIVEKIINSFGKKLSERKLKDAMIGTQIQTTIDVALQTAAENAFDQNYAGAFIAMEARTGALRAVVSRPAFDPNMFLRRITKDEWESLQTNQPFINRAFGTCYPPASPFKLVTLTAALELGIINEHTTWKCNGSLIFGERIHYCNNRNGHGVLTAKQALAQSCNIPFFELAKQISIDTLAAYAHKLGLGQKTHCILPEKAGLIPTKKWKKEVKGEPWWPGETLSVAIGQGPSLATPIQMACMVGAIIEGERVRPRILVHELIEKSPLFISAHVRAFLKESMRMAVTIGTGKQLSVFKDIEIYFKSGTAQVCDRQKPNKQFTDREHAWCLSHITYKNYPPLTLAILLEHAGSARYALEVIKRFLVDYCKIMDGFP